MKKCDIGCSPLTNTIFAGTLNKDKTCWKGDKVDITDSAVKAVFEKMMNESRRDDNSIIEYNYGEKFGTLYYVPKDKKIKSIDK